MLVDSRTTIQCKSDCDLQADEEMREKLPLKRERERESMRKGKEFRNMYPWWERWSHHSQKFLFLFLWELYFAFGKWIIYHLPSFNREKDNKNHDKKIIYPEMLKKKKDTFEILADFLIIDNMCLSDEGRKMSLSIMNLLTVWEVLIE